ncbi:30S ribosomal protein S19 [Methanomicrobiaceae archaeon CYW5]|uniref:30S ribosomal protein S19e n=1 Tax=Methanovulcanius yangii TaxID=1789227 RepID=UPI0029CA6CDD|nr:30S ribosomal protein S19e [Methanovulcanius yangii]MBT8507133.1 30S ribosomal protein S19 [Methanovulcanius yangii]
MTTVYDIPPEVLIQKAAEELKAMDAVESPDWAQFAKTGVHKEAPPYDENWWYIRAASVLRRIYVDGPVGVERLRTFYGGKKNRGSNPSQFRKGSGSVLRKIVQQLEQEGLVGNTPEGRVITAKGRSFLDGVAFSAKPEIVEQNAALAKY